MKWGLIVLPILMTPIISGCIEHLDSQGDDWTVMIYMAGDNSLSDVVDRNLEEITSAGSTNGLDIVILSDKNSDGDSHLYKVRMHDLVEQPLWNIWLKRPDEVYTGRYETLQSFVNWSMTNHSSSHYLLIIWGHGAGWKGAAEDKGDILNLTEMRLALSDKRIDIIGFDACFMGAVEVYQALENNANYIVASEKKMPRAGWPYEKILGHIMGHSTQEVGKRIVDSYIDAYEGGKKDSESLSIELALIKTRTGLCGALKDFLDRDPNIDLSSPCRFEDEDTADISSIIQDENVTNEFSKTVVRIGKWDNPNSTFKASNCSGLSIYCPKESMNEAYREIDFATYTRWDRFIC